jgi:hypothetical protein
MSKTSETLAVAAFTISPFIIAYVVFIALPVILMVITGDFPGSSAFYGLQEDDSFVVQLLELRKAFK